MADGMPGPRSGKRRISLVFFDAGGGHRNAATALKVEIERQGLPFEVSLVNLQEVLDPLDILRKLTGLRIQDLYNKMLRNGWTLGWFPISTVHFERASISLFRGGRSLPSSRTWRIIPRISGSSASSSTWFAGPNGPSNKPGEWDIPIKQSSRLRG